MNLLFYTDNKISPTKGGTEHATLTVAKQLHNQYGCKCWAVHTNDENTPNCDCFEKQITIDKYNICNHLRQIIIENHIDVFFSESSFDMSVVVDNIRKSNNINLQNIFVHHFSPAWESYYRANFGPSFHTILKSRGKEKIAATIRCVFFPIFGTRCKKWYSTKYRNAYNAADKVVLLTKGYIHEFMKFANLNDGNKFYAIPNALSLPDILTKDKYENEKKKVVLVVSRLEEIQKRISLVLKIWKQIYKDERAKDWKLLIAGEGDDGERYRKYVKRHNIPNIEFLGRVNPVPYYTESSIFMMTSKSEGFPLTLNEAMQYGAVPLAFDSFAAIRDIINDDKNGYIIQEKNLNEYSKKLLSLMSDNNIRHKMAMNALDSCQRYLPERIGNMWWNLINK